MASLWTALGVLMGISFATYIASTLLNFFNIAISTYLVYLLFFYALAVFNLVLPSEVGEMFSSANNTNPSRAVV